LKTHGSAAVIEADQEVLAELRALQPPPGSVSGPWSQFILVSTRPPRPELNYRYYRCEKTFKRLYAWVRGKGVDVHKPFHELRKELGALTTTGKGIYAASRLLRHSDISTTARHYADQKERISIGLGKNLVPVATNAEEISKPQQPAASGQSGDAEYSI
jgi:integrase